VQAEMALVHEKRCPSLSPISPNSLTAFTLGGHSSGFGLEASLSIYRKNLTLHWHCTFKSAPGLDGWSSFVNPTMMYVGGSKSLKGAGFDGFADQTAKDFGFAALVDGRF
jgi:hypothetical protein